MNARVTLLLLLLLLTANGFLPGGSGRKKKMATGQCIYNFWPLCIYVVILQYIAAIISLNGNNWLGFIRHTRYIFCEA
jgi:hypothetical protein